MAARLLPLQRTAGNAAVTALLRPPVVVQGDFLDEAKVGLELTFQSDYTSKCLNDSGFVGRPLGGDPKGSSYEDAGSSKNAQYGLQWWNRLRTNWETLAGSTGEVDADLTCRDAGSNKHFGNVDGAIVKRDFVYRELDVEPDEGHLWTWTLSLDPGVVEIQTEKTEGKSFDPDQPNPISAVVEQHIFDVARALGFRPGGGGGHVNVDFASGFDGDYRNLTKILSATDDVVLGLRDNDALRDLVDWENEGSDPFIDSVRRTMKTNSAGTQWSEEGATEGRRQRRSWDDDVGGHPPRDAESFEAFRKAHAKWLWTHPTATQFNKRDRPDRQFGDRLADDGDVMNVLHYQAVNIDHLRKQEPEDARRLEFRFFKGQRSLQDIYDSIRLVERIKQRAAERR